MRVKRTDDDVPLAALDSVKGVLAGGSGANPRALLRLVNNFLIDCALWPLTSSRIEKRSLPRCYP